MAGEFISGYGFFTRLFHLTVRMLIIKMRITILDNRQLLV